MAESFVAGPKCWRAVCVESFEHLRHFGKGSTNRDQILRTRWRGFWPSLGIVKSVPPFEIHRIRTCTVRLMVCP
jgi:hypothetical protein